MSSLLISFTEKLPQVSFGSFLVDNLDRRMRDHGSSTLNMRPVSLFEGFNLTSDRLFFLSYFPPLVSEARFTLQLWISARHIDQITPENSLQAAAEADSDSNDL